MATIRRSPCRQCPIDTTVRGLRAARCHAERPFRVCNRFRRGRFRRAIGRGEAAGKGGRSSAAGCPACGWDSPCGTPIQLLERIKDLQAFHGDGPIPHFPVDQPLSEDIEVRRTAS